MSGRVGQQHGDARIEVEIASKPPFWGSSEPGIYSDAPGIDAVGGRVPP